MYLKLLSIFHFKIEFFSIGTSIRLEKHFKSGKIRIELIDQLISFIFNKYFGIYLFVAFKITKYTIDSEISFQYIKLNI